MGPNEIGGHAEAREPAPHLGVEGSGGAPCGEVAEPEALKEALHASDLAFIRVLEDLIAVLLEKNVIMFTDLPAAAQAKVQQRQRIRTYMGNLGALIGDEGEDDCLL